MDRIRIVFSAAHVPSIHNGYSWFYAVQVTLTTVELVWAWAQTAVWSVQYMQLFVLSHWCEPDELEVVLIESVSAKISNE